MNLKLKLREWQENAQRSVIKTFSDKQKFFLLQATPGGGKTICALSIFKHLVDKGVVSHVIVIAPTVTLMKQWRQEALDIFGVNLTNNILYNTMPDFEHYRGMVMTYQGMNECAESLRIFCNHNDTLIISDEIHHVADGKSWGESFLSTTETSKHILALTGTPWASNGQTIPYVRYSDDGYAQPDFSYGKTAAIKDNVCRVTEFHPMQPENLTFLNDQTGENLGTFATLDEARKEGIRGAYTKTLQNTRHMKTMFLEADEQLSELRSNGAPDAAGLLVAPDIKTAHKFQDELYALTGEDYLIVHSKSGKPHEAIDTFRDSNERWLISVDMVTEGVDIKRLQVCLFLSAKNTELYFRQVIGRIERIRDKNKYIDHTGYFYYTNTAELYDLVKRIEQENKAGLELKFCEECGKNPCECPCGRCGQRPCICRRPPPPEYDPVFLQDVETLQQGLIANGFHFSNEIVSKAILRKRSHVILKDVPLFVVCKVILAEMEVPTPESDKQERKAVPLDIQKERLRKRIAKELIRKLGAHFARQPSGELIKTAHTNINKMVGIKFTDASVSLDMLEDKHDFITNSKVPEWLC